MALVRSFTAAAAVASVAVVALSGCSNSGSATGPSATSSSAAAPTTTSSAAAPTTSTTAAPAPSTPDPGVAATEAPKNTTAPAPQSPAGEAASPQPQTGQVPRKTLPPDPKMYPPPDVPRTAATTSSEQAYVKDLQNGGLPVAVPGTIELNIGRAICGELGTGDNASKITAMKRALLPVALAAGSAGGSKLTGEQVVDLYIDTARADLC